MWRNDSNGHLGAGRRPAPASRAAGDGPAGPAGRCPAGAGWETLNKEIKTKKKERSQPIVDANDVAKLLLALRIIMTSSF